MRSPISEIVPKAERSRKIKKRSVCQLSSFFVSFRFCIGNFKRERERKRRCARARVFFGFSASSDDDEKITEIVRGTITEDKRPSIVAELVGEEKGKLAW